MPDQLTTLEGHTEGPWLRGRDLPTERRELIRSNEQAESNFDVDAVYGAESKDPKGTWSTYHPVAEFIEWTEDARLIAAAPDLLAIANELADRLTMAGQPAVAAEAFLKRGIKPPALTWRETTGRDEV